MQKLAYAGMAEIVEPYFDNIQCLDISAEVIPGNM